MEPKAPTGQTATQAQHTKHATEPSSTLYALFRIKESEVSWLWQSSPFHFRRCNQLIYTIARKSLPYDI